MAASSHTMRLEEEEEAAPVVVPGAVPGAVPAAGLEAARWFQRGAGEAGTTGVRGGG